jgi:hypothetical protein
MPWFIYSSEEMPNTNMMGKARYTPDGRLHSLEWSHAPSV